MDKIVYLMSLHIDSCVCMCVYVCIYVFVNICVLICKIFYEIDFFTYSNIIEDKDSFESNIQYYHR